MTDYAELTARYDAYVNAYRASDGSLPEMMQLKRDHTDRVVANAAVIADGEGFSARERQAALSASLLHDTGRYEQLRRFNTFRDSESVDHAVFSHDIVRDSGWLSDYPDSEPILNAVLYHNRRDLPDGMDALTAVVSHTVRDADKLDIFRVLEERTANPDWKTDTRAFWNLQIVADPNPSVVACVEKGLPVDYQSITSLADFVLIQVGWMVSGLHFATSRRLCATRGHLDFRRRFLKELTASPAIDRLCDLAEKGL